MLLLDITQLITKLFINSSFVISCVQCFLNEKGARFKEDQKYLVYVS